MKVLIIKLSSIGDLIHTFPAILDAKKNIKNITFDWLVDENFQDIPKLLNYSKDYKIINQIIPIPLRSFKKSKKLNHLKKTLSNLIKLRRESYDLVIDAQGLIKSAVISKFFTKTKTIGFTFNSCREPLASYFYYRKFYIDRKLHAIIRIRQLFSLALNYKINQESYYTSLKQTCFPKLNDLNTKKINNYIVFLHGTTWETKCWPEEYWQKLSQLLSAKNLQVVVTYSNLKEQKFVEHLATHNNNVVVIPSMDLEKITCMLANAMAVVAVDTGFAHLAGALGIPVVAIYGATSTIKSGVNGHNCINLQSEYHCSPCLSKVCLEYKQKLSLTKQPCLKEITPEIVFSKLHAIL